MIAPLKPYPKTKGSGVTWIGEIPEHWEVRRLGGLGRFSASGIDKNTVAGEPLVRMVNYLDVYDNPVRQLDTSRSYQQVSCPEWKKQIHAVRCGDLIFTPSSETPEDIGISAVCTEDLEDTVYSYHVIRFRAIREIDLDFKRYWCNSQSVRDQFSARCKGTTRQILTRSDFRSIWVAVPTPNEQVTIARFLDYADRRIRRYIRAKEKLIELLEEQKQAIIHQAVTGQIDVRTGQPYSAYKDSGVEWLGEVPEHWVVSRLGRLVDLTVGFPFKSEGFTQSGDDMRLLRGVNIAPGGLRWDKVVRWPVSGVDGFAEYRMRVGDIVVGMDRPIIRGGTRVAVLTTSDVPSLLLQRVARIRVGVGLVRDFALALLGGKSFSDYLAPIFTGISVPHLSPDQIKCFRFALPSAVEQGAIMEHVKSRTDGNQSAIAGATRQIRLLREYRTLLIADVVTGKIDVRGAVAALPDIDPLAAEDTLMESAEAGAEPEPALLQSHP